MSSTHLTDASPFQRNHLLRDPCRRRHDLPLRRGGEQAPHQRAQRGVPRSRVQVGHGPQGLQGHEDGAGKEAEDEAGS